MFSVPSNLVGLVQQQFEFNGFARARFDWFTGQNWSREIGVLGNIIRSSAVNIGSTELIMVAFARTKRGTHGVTKM